MLVAVVVVVVVVEVVDQYRSVVVEQDVYVVGKWTVVLVLQKVAR